MGCPTTVRLEQTLTFTVVTHTAETGEVTDADALPTYRVYEQETGTPILTGTMAFLDAASTTGFYSESLACTAANGFENGKSYSIYIQATVDGVTGAVTYGFGVDSVFDEVVDGTATARGLLRGLASALFGKLSGAATTTILIRDISDTKARITATVDAEGNRTAVSTDLT